MNLPYRDSDDWFISFVDIETTGLKPGYHEPVDVGIVLADLDGRKKSEFFRRIMPAYPKRADDQAVNCNGFSPARWEYYDAVTKSKAVPDIIDFYSTTTENRPVIFCAYNESFDHPFLDHLFRSQGESINQLYNYALDLPSIAWGGGDSVSSSPAIG